MKQNKLAEQIEKLWLDCRNDEECEKLSIKLAEFLGCNQHKLYGALTNLVIICQEE